MADLDEMLDAPLEEVIYTPARVVLRFVVAGHRPRCVAGANAPPVHTMHVPPYTPWGWADTSINSFPGIPTRSHVVLPSNSQALI